MPGYSWPANLVKKGENWITSLVDWPDVVSIDATAEEPVVQAISELSNAVQVRIRDGLNIPFQSETRPGQIQVPINADGSAHLDVYLETKSEKRFRQQSEIDQANREKRASYLSEYRINLDSVERLRDQTNRGATEFASIAIRSAYLLNGSALVAIPAILKLVGNSTLTGGILLTSVISFFAGIFLSSVTNYLAYRSMFTAGNGHDLEISARVIEVKNAHYPSDDISIDQAKIVSIRSDAQDKATNANRLADIAVISFGLSVLVFLFGLGIIIFGIGI